MTTVVATVHCLRKKALRRQGAIFMIPYVAISSNRRGDRVEAILGDADAGSFEALQ
jgi:hypothetical protein